MPPTASGRPSCATSTTSTRPCTPGVWTAAKPGSSALPNICSPSGPTGRSPIPCSAHPQARRSSTPRRAGPSSPPAAKCAAPPSSERNPSPSFCTSNTNTASADRATARQSSGIARRGQGGVDGVMPFSGALQRGCFSLSLSLSSFLRHHLFRFLHAHWMPPLGIGGLRGILKIYCYF